MEKRAFNFEDLAVLELPDRALMGKLWVDADHNDVFVVLKLVLAILADLDVDVKNVEVNILTGDITIDTGDINVLNICAVILSKTGANACRFQS